MTNKSSKTLVACVRLLALGVFALLTLFIGSTAITPQSAHADTACSPNGIVSGGSGSNWFNGNGVNVCDNGSSYSNNYGNNCVYQNGAPSSTFCTQNNIYSGYEWQCVEFVNRFYITNNWITSRWAGNGNTLINSLPTSLTDQMNGSISYVNPGDVVTLDDGQAGHTGIINTIDGNGTIHIINQNAGSGGLNSSAYIDSGSLGASNAHYHMTGWSGYTVQAIVHHPGGAPTNNTVLEVKKLTDSDGTNEVVWSKASDVFESWWNSSSNGIQLGNLIDIQQKDIKSFDISLYSSGEHDLFTATTNNVWETWWFPGQGLHTSEILQNIGNISKIIKSVGPDGVTQQLYVLTNTGAYEYWWNSNSNGIQHGTIMTLANPVDEYKALEPDGTQALYISDQTYPYELHWGPGINGIQQTTFTNFSGITSLSFSEDSDNKHRLYIGNSSGWIYEASWYPNGSIGYWTMTGGAPVVALQKWEDDSEQVLYEATAGGVFEYYWPTTSNSLSSDTIKGGLSNVHSFVRSTDPGGVQSVYTATGTNILESWWIPGGNGITTGQIE